jgi:asparagine synthase (glutamine-hydrolysing)
VCGIAGVLLHDPAASPDGAALARMGEVLRHRGPDDHGVFVNGPAGLAHRRLSIIDLAAGGQPMHSADGRVTVVFNGEIYNYPELRAGLEAKGHRFRTHSDTEVLVELFRLEGVASFSKLNGMFACAFWDRERRELVLLRDRWGKKPLFYAEDRARFLFGSEIKALLAHGGLDRSVHPAALHEYLSQGYITGEQTIFEGVRRLLPGHYLAARDGVVTTAPYYRLAFGPDPGAIDEEEFLERLEVTLRGAVRRRLMSEVPLGAFLSGGLDSSVVVALMAELSDRPVRTFSIGFEEKGYSELDDARAVARHLGTDHTETIVRPSAFEVLPELVWHCDEPFGDSSAVPTYYVSRAAREHVTVALSGDGGDEVFAGYTRYRIARDRESWRRVPRWLGQGVAGGLTRVLPFTTPGWNVLANLAYVSGRGRIAGLGIYPYIRDALYTREWGRRAREHDPATRIDAVLEPVRCLDVVSQLQYLDMHHYLTGDILTKVDRMSMAVSLEVRAPLLDYEVVELMAAAPLSFKLRGDVSKYALRRLAAKLLPASTLGKRKQGFALPQGPWFQGQLYARAEEILLDRRSLARGYFEPRVLRTVLAEHRAGRRDYGTWLWCFIVLEMWHRIFVDADSRRV